MAQVTYAEGGRLLRVRLPSVSRHIRPGKRAKCRGFSRRARLAMLRVLNAVNQALAGTTVFVTLTYPADHPSARASKRDLDTYLKRLARQYPAACGFWKLEPQKRAAPHYHLLLFFGRTLSDAEFAALHEWSAVAWYEVVASNDPRHLYVNRRPKSCERMRTWDGVLSYGAKYVGKLIDDLPGWSDAGKFWGYHNRRLLPIKLVTEDVSPRVANLVRRTARRFAARQPSDRFVVTDPDRGGRVKKRGRLHAAEIKMWRYDADCHVHQVKRGRLLSSGGLTVFIGAATAARLLAWAKSQETTPADLDALGRSVQRRPPARVRLGRVISRPSVDDVRRSACPHLPWVRVDGDHTSAWQTGRWADRAADCFGSNWTFRKYRPSPHGIT